MRLSGHIFTLFLINIFIKLLIGAVQDNLSVRHDRHLPALFQFFRGLHGENYQPYYFLPSILVFPSINQQHNTIIQESAGQENYQEISKSLHMKKFAKLVSNSNSIDINETVEFNRTLHVKNSSIENYRNEESKLTQFDNVTERITTKQLTAVTDENVDTEPPTEAIGIYPPAKNNNTYINSLSITTDINEEYGNYTETYSHKEDSDMKKSLLDSKNTQIIEKNLLPPLEKPLLIKFKPNVSENNLLNNNGWQHFSTQKKDTLVVKGFRPLAGLYYDGFLHKPITRKNGFNPI